MFLFELRQVETTLGLFPDIPKQIAARAQGRVFLQLAQNPCGLRHHRVT
jgi:hypothetical protein